MQTLELTDIQGIIIRGYSNMPTAAFVLVQMPGRNEAQQWLNLLSTQITPGSEKNGSTAVNIAFTFAAMQLLGLNNEALETFPLEFEDGMITPHKKLFLGDFDKSDPANWDWGGNSTPTVHAVLMLYAIDSATLDSLHLLHINQLNQFALTALKTLDTSDLIERKEHFGFQDGISQPTIKDLPRIDDPENTVATGEFILGYTNEYQQFPLEPSVPQSLVASTLLSPAQSGAFSLGKNGSFMVFRQLEQHVGLFWQYLKKVTCSATGSANEAEMIRLAAKMMGRWPGGAPTVLCPDMEQKEHNNTNKFEYRKDDEGGLKCPYASHIRRSHPRDALDMNKNASIKIANKHRLLRRGRSYGAPVAPSMAPQDILKVTEVQGTRGLHFICFNADIGRQFEFVQNAWSNNPKFNGLYDERDPIIGNHHHPNEEKTTGTFSLPVKNELRSRYTDVPEFVTVKGGSYFFMPGLKAIKYLATF